MATGNDTQGLCQSTVLILRLEMAPKVNWDDIGVKVCDSETIKLSSIAY